LNLEPLAETYLPGAVFSEAVREGVMVTKNGTIVETAIKVHPAETGPSVLARLTVSTCLVVLILGVWFAFLQA
jgi:hypothetical protein